MSNSKLGKPEFRLLMLCSTQYMSIIFIVNMYMLTSLTSTSLNFLLDCLLRKSEIIDRITFRRFFLF